MLLQDVKTLLQETDIRMRLTKYQSRMEDTEEGSDEELVLTTAIEVLELILEVK